MTDRERLFELIGQVQDEGRDYVDCFVDGDNPKVIKNSQLVDHLVTNGVTTRNWIPVTERIPEQKCFCLTARKGNVHVEFWNGVVFSERNHLGQPTHWMPLPEPPS